MFLKEKIKIKGKIRVHYFFLRHDIDRWFTKMALWFVWKLPRWVVYYSTIRLISNATCGVYSNELVPELKAMEALKRWEKLTPKERWEHEKQRSTDNV